MKRPYLALSAAFALPVMLAVAVGVAGASAPPYRLEHPVDAGGRRVSGDEGSVFTGHDVELRALVLDDEGRPAPGVVVVFDQVAPAEKLLGKSETDFDGIATLTFTAGAEAEEYSIVAHTEGVWADGGRNVYTIPVRETTWVLFMLFGLAGGLGLFLFGMDMMSSSLQRSAGGRLRAILGTLTANRYLGAVVGAVVTMVIQSSSATTVMLVSFVQAQLMSFAQTLGVILGADIGTTITAQLIAFKLTDYALLMIALGFGLKFLGRRHKLRNLGNVLLGFGMLFYGMAVMSMAMSPLRTYRPFLDLLAGLENPLLGILIGTTFTALIQSSSAFTGVIIVLAQQGFLSLDAGIPLILGANIGTCITAVLASLNSGREAKRVALAHTLFKITGVLAMVFWIPVFADFVRSVSPGGAIEPADTVRMAKFIPRQVANAHTIFNVGLALVFLPFTGLFGRLVVRLLPDKLEPIAARYRPRYLEPSMLQTPTLALNLAKVEILRMGEIVRHMATDVIKPFVDNDMEMLDDLHEREHEIDDLDVQILAYLIDIGMQDLSEEQTEEVYLMMHVTKQYEFIADIIDKELCPLAHKKASLGADFSPSGRKEVEAYHIKMLKQISRGLEAFREDSLETAKKMTVKQARYVALEGDYRQAHFERVSGNIRESLATSEVHLSLMDALRKMNSHSADIARAMLTRFEGEKALEGNVPD
ncbi:Na/Pi symporter [bacterium]|nr:Na/Pi symporter [bacterium]MBU1071718.1 Na/Pi symporter [bacterium]MBU1674847.1 Na/Pi symporter [bacterium]